MVKFPKPQIPTQPVLSLASFFPYQNLKQNIPSVLDAASVKFVTSGRVAIALALKQMGIGKGDKVLIPAYHCPAMVEPVIWTEAEPVFYKIQPDTSVDLDDIQAKLDNSVKLLLVAHYFGFPQNLTKIRNFCDKQKIFLLEDCAHSFFGEFGGRPLGSYGDYAVASSMKFFPIYEGGCLISTRNNIEQIQLHSAGLSFEVKAAVNALEKGFEYNRMNLLKRTLLVPIWFKDYIWKSLKHKTASKKSIGPGASDGGFGFEASWLNKRSSFFSRYLITFASKARIAIKRRENYNILLEGLTGLPGCKPLFHNLPAGIVPHVFPLLVDNSQEIFPILKQSGIPIIRFGEYLWRGMDESICPNSINLSRNLLQFPCHQELKPEEIKWMIAQIRRIFLQTEY